MEKCTACSTLHRTITCYTIDKDEDNKEWLTNLMSSLITLLQVENETKLEMFLTRGDVNCHLLDILRSLTTEELEQLRPTAVMHKSYTKAECHEGDRLDPLGRVLDIDEFDQVQNAWPI